MGGKQGPSSKEVQTSLYYRKAAAIAQQLVQDPNKGLGKVSEAQSKFGSSNFQGSLWDTFRELLEYSRDSLTGTYPSSWQSRVSALTAIVYTLSPIDLIPDFIPVIGWLDDFTVISACAHYISEDLRDYREWRREKRYESEIVAIRHSQQGSDASSPPVEHMPDADGTDFDSCETETCPTSCRSTDLSDFGSVNDEVEVMEIPWNGTTPLV